MQVLTSGSGEDVPASASGCDGRRRSVSVSCCWLGRALGRGCRCSGSSGQGCGAGLRVLLTLQRSAASSACGGSSHCRGRCTCHGCSVRPSPKATCQGPPRKPRCGKAGGHAESTRLWQIRHRRAGSGWECRGPPGQAGCRRAAGHAVNTGSRVSPHRSSAEEMQGADLGGQAVAGQPAAQRPCGHRV